MSCVAKFLLNIDHESRLSPYLLKSFFVLQCSRNFFKPKKQFTILKIFENKREMGYREEFHATRKNWNQNRLPAAILILGTMMVTMGAVIEPLRILFVIGFGIVIGLALQQRRLNKKRKLGIFDPNSQSTRNFLGFRY